MRGFRAAAIAMLFGACLAPACAKGSVFSYLDDTPPDDGTDGGADASADARRDGGGNTGGDAGTPPGNDGASDASTPPGNDGASDASTPPGDDATADTSAEPPPPEAAVEAAPDIVAEPEAAAPTVCTDLPRGVCRYNDCAMPTAKHEVHWPTFDSSCTTLGHVCCALTDCLTPAVCQGFCYGSYPTDVPRKHCGAYVCCAP